MALVTKTIWDATAMDLDYQPTGDRCFVDIVYDDVDLRLRSVRAVNPASSAWSFWFRISRMDRSQAREGIRPPGTDVTISIGTGAAVRLQLTVNAKGALVNLEGDFAYPAP